MKKNVAKFISLVFDPAMLGIIILIVAVIVSGMSSMETISWIIGVIILNGFIPLLFVLYFQKKGLVFDAELANEEVHRQRIQMFFVFLVIVAIEFMILLSTTKYQPLLAVFTGGMVAISLTAVVSYYWKISLHSAMITFFVCMIMFLFGFQFWPIIVTIPIVGWSRLVLKRHTLMQLVAGFFLALIVVSVTFIFYKLI